MGRCSRSPIEVRWNRGIPRFVIAERYEKRIKWGLRLLAAVGILSSLAVFPTWYSSLGFTLAIFIVEQILERTVFFYSSMFVQPLPHFDLDPSEWTAMAFLFPVDSKTPPGLGLVFKSSDYGRRFFEWLSSWNYEADEDSQDNICVSVVLSEESYDVFLYPSPARAERSGFYSAVESKVALTKHGKEHLRLVVSVVCRRNFTKTPPFSIDDFVERYPPGHPFVLLALALDGKHAPIEIAGARRILKRAYKVRRPDELDEDEVERFLEPPRERR